MSKRSKLMVTLANRPQTANVLKPSSHISLTNLENASPIINGEYESYVVTSQEEFVQLPTENFQKIHQIFIYGRILRHNKN